MNAHAKVDKPFLKTIDDFKELRDQLYLLENNDSAVESPAVKCFKHFRLEFIAKHAKYTEDFTTQGYSDVSDKDLLTKATGSLKCTLTEALYQPLLKQNWSEILGILRYVTADTDQKEVLPRLGCEVINHVEDPLTRCALMRDFVNHLRNHEDLDVSKEFALEYTLFCIYNKDHEAAKAEFQLFDKDKRQQKTKKDSYIEHLCRAYHGLFMYLEWKEHKDYADELENQIDTEASFVLMSQDWTSKVQVTDIALKAINIFNGIEKIEGTWDIFVEKYVELLVYSGRLQEAFTVLVNYSEHHTDSLNAQKYLYMFCVEHFPSRKDIIVEQLEVIVELNPADPLVLEYCMVVEDTCKLIPCLFILLDYPVWQSDVKPWKMLTGYLERIFLSRLGIVVISKGEPIQQEQTQLMKIMDASLLSDLTSFILLREEQTDDALRSVKDCWSVRESWWPAFHFNNHIVMKDSNDLELLQQKYVVNVILIGHDNSFAGLARQKLEEGGYSSELEHVFSYHRPAS